MPRRFRKKPVVIEAIQLTQDNRGQVWSWIHDGLPLEANSRAFLADTTRLVVRTLEGDMEAREGDWIIKKVKGEFYPCKPDIFAATYEAAD